MGSRGYRRLFRRARAEIRRRRREAMIGACNDVVEHLAKRIGEEHARRLARETWPGLDGLYDPRPPVWPEPLNALLPDRTSGMTTGTIGGRARTNPLLRHHVELDQAKSDELLRFWGKGPSVIINPIMPANSFAVLTDEEHDRLLHKFWRDFKIANPLSAILDRHA